MMMAYEVHQLMLMAVDEATGDETWGCPLCGRKITINWNKTDERTVLEPGDQTAQHVAQKLLVFFDGLVEGELDEEPSGDDDPGLFSDFIDSLDMG